VSGGAIADDGDAFLALNEAYRQAVRLAKASGA
jgi:hypothetical protein